MSVTFERLLPAGAPVDAHGHVEGLPMPVPQDRPHVLANLVASIDGRLTVDGRSVALSDAADRAMFHALRERVDAVLVGTRTLADEPYGRMIRDAAARERRRRAGRSDEPLLVLVSRSGGALPAADIFGCADAGVVVFAPEPPRTPDAVADVRHEPLDAAADGALRQMLVALRGRYGVRTLLCEGGPTLLGLLLGAHALDSLMLTVAPVIAGGEPAPLTGQGPPPTWDQAPPTLSGALRHESTLFLHYAFARA